MANWKALTWSEQVTTGKQAARHVLTVLCLKCDDDFRVFSDAGRLAEFCELSTRRLYGWRDYLEAAGLITVIRRVRPNGSEAKPITLLNHPEAPHLNGVPVVLDYASKQTYPRHPRALQASGIDWISGGAPYGVHPSNRQFSLDDSSPGQPDELTRCPSSTKSAEPQVGQPDDSSPGQPDDSSPHGGDSSSPLDPFPFRSTPLPSESGTGASTHNGTALDASPNPDGRTDMRTTETENTQKQSQRAHTGPQCARSVPTTGSHAKSSHSGTQAASTFDGDRGQSHHVVDDPDLVDELARIDLRKRQRDQLATEVNRALLRFPEVKVRAYLHSKAREARTVKYVLDAFRQYSDAIKDMPSDPNTRDAAVIEQLATPQANEPSGPSASLARCLRPTPEPDLTSPVPWLTDAEHAALSPQDRATVRLSTRPDAPALIGRRVAAIRAQHESTAGVRNMGVTKTH